MTRGDAEAGVVELSGAGAEACGPLLRTALVLSQAARRPFVMRWAEHGAAALAEAERVYRGLAPVLGAQRLERVDEESVRFTPGPLRPGSYTLECENAPLSSTIGAAALALSLAGGSSTLRARGLTHPTAGTTFHHVAFGWLPLAERLGLGAEIALDSAGFAAEGGGLVSARVFGAPKLRPLDLGQRGMLTEVRAIALVANLGIGIAMATERRLSERLRARGIAAEIEALPMPCQRGRGLAVAVVAQFERSRAVFVQVGEDGKPAEQVADAAVDDLQRFLARRGAVPGPLAEQLFLPMALAASSFGAPGAIGKEARGASRMSTAEVTGSLLAMADVARALVDVDVQVQGLPGDEGLVEVRPRAQQ